MYKYSYLLSDSFRNQRSIGKPSNNQFNSITMDYPVRRINSQQKHAHLNSYNPNKFNLTHQQMNTPAMHFPNHRHQFINKIGNKSPNRSFSQFQPLNLQRKFQDRSQLYYRNGISPNHASTQYSPHIPQANIKRQSSLYNIKRQSSLYNKKAAHQSSIKNIYDRKNNIKKENLHIFNQDNTMLQYNAHKNIENENTKKHQEDLQNRLKKLNGQSDKIHNPSKEVDLQSKLKDISSKYNSIKMDSDQSSYHSTKIGLSPYNQLRQEIKLTNLNEFSFKKSQQTLKNYERPTNQLDNLVNRQPMMKIQNRQFQNNRKFEQYKAKAFQHKLNIQKFSQDNMTNKNQVKEMISNHLNMAHDKQNAYKKNHDNILQKMKHNEPTHLNNNCTTIQNLQTLQQKIRSTIQPYLHL